MKVAGGGGRSAMRASLVASLLAIGSCGGGGSGDSSSPAPTAAPAPPPSGPSAPAVAVVRVSGPTPFAAGCNGAQAGTLFVDAEVEPTLAVDPLNPNVLVAAWQQDRWSNGGSQGIVSAVSSDGGATWTERPLPFSRCAGGTAANGGDFDRASNPWVAFAPDGSAYQLALAFSGVVLEPGSQSAMLVARSTDGGATWGATTTLIRDGAGFFDDKGAIAADPHDARYVYAVWDRLAAAGGGPAMLARSVDGGATWSPAAPIFDPGASAQTIGNVPAVLPDGTVVDLFTRIDFAPNGTQASQLAVITSSDHGATWSAPKKVADLLSVGTRDPKTGAAVRDAGILAELAVDGAGTLVVVWQDARFSGGARDAVALSRSSDGGATWSAPVAINGSPSAAAFDPFVTVRADGVVGVIYDDFRDDASNGATLPTDGWLARSSDGGQTWTETRIAGPFDLDLAPKTDTGYFLGDYEALRSIGGRFVALFTVGNADLANRTDIATAPPSALASAPVEAHAVVAAPDVTAALRARSSDALRDALRHRYGRDRRPPV